MLETKNKNLILSVVALAALAGLVFLWQGQKKPAEQARQIPRKDVPKNQVPAGFPEGIPIEPGARVIYNYESALPDARKQAVRIFESAKSVGENLQTYLDILAKTGWEVTSKTEIENFASIFANKAGATLGVNISKNSKTGSVEVTLNSIK